MQVQLAAQRSELRRARLELMGSQQVRVCLAGRKGACNSRLVQHCTALLPEACSIASATLTCPPACLLTLSPACLCPPQALREARERDEWNRSQAAAREAEIHAEYGARELELRAEYKAREVELRQVRARMNEYNKRESRGAERVCTAAARGRPAAGRRSL